jgi:hypothetical protein
MLLHPVAGSGYGNLFQLFRGFEAVGLRQGGFPGKQQEGQEEEAKSFHGAVVFERSDALYAVKTPDVVFTPMPYPEKIPSVSGS